MGAGGWLGWLGWLGLEVPVAARALLQPPAYLPARCPPPPPLPCSNNTQPCTELFCPIYSLGASPDPLRAAAAARRRRRLLQAGGQPEPEIYMGVGLDSGWGTVRGSGNTGACRVACLVCSMQCLAMYRGLKLQHHP